MSLHLCSRYKPLFLRPVASYLLCKFRICPTRPLPRCKKSLKQYRVYVHAKENALFGKLTGAKGIKDQLLFNYMPLVGLAAGGMTAATKTEGKSAQPH